MASLFTSARWWKLILSQGAAHVARSQWSTQQSILYLLTEASTKHTFPMARWKLSKRHQEHGDSLVLVANAGYCKRLAQLPRQFNRRCWHGSTRSQTPHDDNLDCTLRQLLGPGPMQQ